MYERDDDGAVNSVSLIEYCINLNTMTLVACKSRTAFFSPTDFTTTPAQLITTRLER